MAKIMDVGALCFYAGVVQEEFPGFSVERCFDQLLLLQQEVDKRGFLLNQEHLFFLIAKNEKAGKAAK